MKKFFQVLILISFCASTVFAMETEKNPVVPMQIEVPDKTQSSKDLLPKGFRPSSLKNFFELHGSADCIEVLEIIEAMFKTFNNNPDKWIKNTLFINRIIEDTKLIFYSLPLPRYSEEIKIVRNQSDQPRTTNISNILQSKDTFLYLEIIMLFYKVVRLKYCNRHSGTYKKLVDQFNNFVLMKEPVYSLKQLSEQVTGNVKSNYTFNYYTKTENLSSIYEKDQLCANLLSILLGYGYDFPNKGCSLKNLLNFPALKDLIDSTGLDYLDLSPIAEKKYEKYLEIKIEELLSKKRDEFIGPNIEQLF